MKSLDAKFVLAKGAGGIHTLIAMLILMVGVFLLAQWLTPQIFSVEIIQTLEKYLGFSWPFFATVLVFNLYVTAAWLIEMLEFAPPRNWNGVDQALHWATEACPLVGLLTTFASLLTALLAYGAAGPGQPGTQAAFITQFAIAFGSSIAGGLLSLVSFTLHRLLPETNFEASSE
jgi:hypothetical protein